MSVWSGASDNWDEGLDNLLGDVGDGFAGVFHKYSPPSWLGPTGFYAQDVRAMPGADAEVIWDSVYVWATTFFQHETMFFSMEPDPVAPPSDDRRYLLTLQAVPDSVPDAPPVGTTWELDPFSPFSVELPAFRAENGLDGYRFSFTMTSVVPEPGSGLLLAGALLALLRRARPVTPLPRLAPRTSRP